MFNNVEQARDENNGEWPLLCRCIERSQERQLPIIRLTADYVHNA